MVISTCDSCGGTLHWDWTEAFCKFGFNDGDGQVETSEVTCVLEDAGYEVTENCWGLHNTVITSIKKDGVEQIPHDSPEYTFGYDDPRDYFPDDLVKLLDEKLSPTGDYQLMW